MTTTSIGSAAAAVVVPKLRFLSAWFCPYAHRATIALEHHAGRVEYEWVEALGWEQRKDEMNVTGTGKEWWYHWKADELKRSNPSALVPTLIPIDEHDHGTPNEEKSVYESLITIDYIDNIANSPIEKQRLVPSNPYLAAKCRYWAEKVNRDCCSPYYGVLVRKEEAEQREHFEKLVNGLKAFSREIEKNGDGHGFLGGGRLTNADVSLMPWAYRYYIFEHYRGYAIPVNDPELHAYKEWYDYVFSLESVQRTLPDKERYLEHIGKYADSSARSMVANAVRRGVAAHEIEDEKDKY